MQQIIRSVVDSEKTTSLLPTVKETKHEKYNRSEKGRERYARYRATTKGILNDYKQQTRRWMDHKIARIAELESELECIKSQK